MVLQRPCISSAVSGRDREIVELLDDWLEIELGAQTLAMEKGRETTLDFLFKKPFKVAPKIEIMVGRLWCGLLEHRGAWKSPPISWPGRGDTSVYGWSPPTG
jgi:hypothetical protein